MLTTIPELAHITVEVHQCEGESCLEVNPHDLSGLIRRAKTPYKKAPEDKPLRGLSFN